MRYSFTRAGRSGAVLAIVGLALSLSGPPVAASGATSESAPPTSEITLDVLSIMGSGCPSRTARVSVSPDNTAFRVVYGDFEVQAGGGDGATERKNCQIAVQVNTPHGFTFAVGEARYRGYARLAHGATGLHRTNYYFQGQSDNLYSDHTFTGPLHNGWQTVDRTAIADLVWAPCGKQEVLNINTELRVQAGTVHPRTSSSLSMRTTDASVNTLLQLAWKRCS